VSLIYRLLLRSSASGPIILTPALTPGRRMKGQIACLKLPRKSEPTSLRSRTLTSRSFHTPRNAGPRRSAARCTTSGRGPIQMPRSKNISGSAKTCTPAERRGPPPAA
jgi:hypothetical protein